jgi:excisionase family DNA binding protein
MKSIYAMDPETLIGANNVAAAFGVNPKTVTRWAVAGRLPHIFTMGGHRRYKVADVRALIEAGRSQ